jgi:hypothetical protein
VVPVALAHVLVFLKALLGPRGVAISPCQEGHWTCQEYQEQDGSDRVAAAQHLIRESLSEECIYKPALCAVGIVISAALQKEQRAEYVDISVSEYT